MKLPVEWSRNLTLYEVNIRHYTPEGTFRAFAAHLPRIKALGVGAIWFMPVQPIGTVNRKGSLGSCYSIANYTAINSDYGTLDEFAELVRQIHSMGMYVVLDWVANHTAWDNVWLTRHPEYYATNAEGYHYSPNADWTDVVKLNFDNPAMRTAMAEAMKFWVDMANIDGFRCDMAHLVPTDFWVQLRPQLESSRRLLMIAESQERELLNTAFDVEYPWNIFHTINDIARGYKSVAQLDEILQHEVLDFPENRYQLFFTSNHDENSWNGSAVERLGCGLEAANVLTFTMGGIPLIFNGQEAGLAKRLSFFEKDEIEWKEDKMYPFYQQLTELRRTNPAFWSGSYGGSPLQRIDTQHNYNVFAFVRENRNFKALVVVNFSPRDHHTTLNHSKVNGSYINEFSGEAEILSTDTSLYLKAWEYRVYTLIPG